MTGVLLLWNTAKAPAPDYDPVANYASPAHGEHRHGDWE